MDDDGSVTAKMKCDYIIVVMTYASGIPKREL